MAEDSVVSDGDATLATGGPEAVATLDDRPVLVNAGHADAGGRSEGGRLFVIGDGLELGRRPTAPPGGGTWYIPDGRVSARHARITRLALDNPVLGVGDHIAEGHDSRGGVVAADVGMDQQLDLRRVRAAQ